VAAAMANQTGVVAVVGAGIVGASIAYTLQRRGRSVVLIERDEPGRATSFGNMASIAVTQFAPISRPGIWSRIPGWLADPEGPIRISPLYLPRMLPWFLRFMLAGRRSRVEALERAGATLCARVHDDLFPLLADAGLTQMVSETGYINVYADDAELAGDQEQLALIRRFGYETQTLDAAGLHALEPALWSGIKHAILMPQGRTVADPYRLTVQLCERFGAAGGQRVRGEVVGFDEGDGRVKAMRLADGRRIVAAMVVIAAGVWSAPLARSLQEPIPLETERGYHTQFLAPGVSLRHSLFRPAKAFMVGPIAGGIRVGGTVEMAGLAAPPNYRRARVLAKRAKELLPDLRMDDVSEWMGHRPALPDTIPIISRSARRPNAFYATGHGHLGVTLAATTARLIADLVTDIEPPIDMTPYRVDRF
jgi:D-amino-acid dehydrogenase